MQLLDRLVDLLGFDPFTYLAITILGIVAWTLSSLMGGAVLTGPSLWMRRVALAVAALGTVLFAYTAGSLK